MLGWSLKSSHGHLGSVNDRSTGIFRQEWPLFMAALYRIGDRYFHVSQSRHYRQPVLENTRKCRFVGTQSYKNHVNECIHIIVETNVSKAGFCLLPRNLARVESPNIAIYSRENAKERWFGWSTDERK